jgi:hypothetical protein
MFSRARFCALLALTFMAGSLLTVQFMKNDVHAQGKRVFELRTYHALPGRLPALQARFRDHTLKLFVKHGMTNVGYWTPLDAPASENTLIYVLAHASREAAKKSWDDFRNDPEWQAVAKASEADGKIVEKVESVFMDATDYSPIQ